MDLQDDCAVQSSMSELDSFAKEGGIPLDQCPLQWWAKRATIYPVLSHIARVYLAVPASSAPSERVFSTASLVLSDRRRKLEESRVARLMFLKQNMKLYESISSRSKQTSGQ